MIKEDLKIGFIGAGNMASALISGLIQSNHSASCIMASSPEQEHLNNLSKNFDIKTTNNNVEIVNFADAVLLAVKPNMIETVLREISEDVSRIDPLLISIAAGIKIQDLESYLSSPSRIIRAMPNTPASIREGVTAICANEHINEIDENFAKGLFACVGEVAKIDEKSIDIYTALIGSGPAYVFYLIESMLESSSKLDLDQKEKINLIAAMISGAANLARASNEPPEVLRRNVTSPGGVTQRAIEEFEDNELKKIIIRSMEVAEKKSIELGND